MPTSKENALESNQRSDRPTNDEDDEILDGLWDEIAAAGGIEAWSVIPELPQGAKWVAGMVGKVFAVNGRRYKVKDQL